MVLPSSANTWAIAKCEGIIREKTMAGYEAVLEIIDFATQCTSRGLCNREPQLESWPCVKGATPEKTPLDPGAF